MQRQNNARLGELGGLLLRQAARATLHLLGAT